MDIEYFVGINSGFHDSSVTLLGIENGRIININTWATERITKRKRDGNFPFLALKQLQSWLVKKSIDIDPKCVGVNSFNDMPINQELHFQNHSKNYEQAIEAFGLQKFTQRYNPKIHIETHHLAHAYSCMAQSPFSKAVILVADGMGNSVSHFSDEHPEKEFLKQEKAEAHESISFYLMDEGKLTPISKAWRAEGGESPGEIYEKAAAKIFNNWQEAGKVMGLVAYGSHSEQYKDFEGVEKSGKKFFDNLSDEKFRNIANYAAAVQFKFESQLLESLSEVRKEFPDYNNLIFTGGCALNCLLNAKIAEMKLFENVHVPSFPNDEGISLGVAISAAKKQNAFRFQTTPYRLHKFAFSPESSNITNQQSKIESLFSEHKIQRPKAILDVVAELLNEGKVVAWMQGKTEIGPRALGNRSILALPNVEGIKDRLNREVKFRESFRPYGVTVLSEYVPKYFEVNKDFHSPFMMFAPKVRTQFSSALKEVVHPDGTLRLQTLIREQNPLYYDLIKKVHSKSGLPMLINTSLNVMGQPLADTVEDARVFFDQAKVDALVIGDYLILNGEKNNPSFKS
ncbi:MAG: hypothetical protein KC478_12545 [Bacteriovoracaceae bacterium]|nr:hypothetical protein [Bacteriovoracaceae bacterium]